MAIEFRCSQCNKLLRTADDAGGRQARCPECGAISTVPTVAGSDDVYALQSPPEAGSPFGAMPTSNVASPDNPYQSPEQPSAKPKSNGKAIAALVLGISGMILWCCPLVGFPVTVLGLIFGILAIREQRSTMAIVAIVLSSIGILLTLGNAISGAVMMMAQQARH
jgi:hypothetical protein